MVTTGKEHEEEGTSKQPLALHVGVVTVGPPVGFCPSLGPFYR